MKNLIYFFSFFIVLITVNQSFGQCTGPTFDGSGFPLFPAAIISESSCIDGTAVGGSITFTNPCPTGTTPEYRFGSSFSTLGSYSSTPPNYSQTERVFILTRCACTSDPTILPLEGPLFATNPDICPINSAPIPTMSQWGLIIFCLLVLNLSILFIYKKSHMKSVFH